MLDALKIHWRDYLLEAAGLMVFMLGAGLFTTLFMYPGSPVATAIPSDLLKRVGLGLCMGLVTLGIASTIGDRTGAHINPAVTWAFWRQGKIGGADAVWYTLAQFAGAIVAPVLLLAAIGDPFAHEKVDYATSRPGPGGDLVAFAAEFAISFVLMLAVLVALNSKRLSKRVPGIVAALIAVYIAVESPLSGMSMNPARSFGSALTANQWDGIWIYFAAPMLATLLAVEVYDRMRAARRKLVTADFKPSPHYPVTQGA